MTVQAWLLFDQTQRDDGMELNEGSVGQIDPRKIDNPLANQLGDGDIDNDHYVCPARLLNDPDYTAFYDFCSVLPIRTWDSEVLFLPDPEV